MDSLCKVFIETTDPRSEYTRLLAVDVLISVLVHAVLYTALAHIVAAWFKVEKLDAVFFPVLLIMIMGYGARLMRARTLFSAYKKQGKDEAEALELTRQAMTNAYHLWYFLG